MTVRVEIQIKVYLSAILGGRMSRRVVAASLLIELFLIGPLGRSAYVTKAKS